MLGAFGILGDLGKVLNDFLSVLRLAGTAFTAICFLFYMVKLFRILLGNLKFSYPMIFKSIHSYIIFK